MQYKAIGPDKIAAPVELTDRINSGGEGHIYETDRPGFVAKVYRTGHITENKYLKCNWFVNKQIRYDGICLPTHLLADENGNFVGYLMPKALGDTVASIIHPIELKEKHADLNRIHLASLCVSLLEQIKYLHDNGVLICDLDLQNILVDDLYSTHPKTFIIDCDSFQIGVGHAMQFPGDVGRPLTTPPELQSIPFDEQHRTFSNEYFSIAVMLFKILLPNQSPYMIKGGENDEIALVRAGNFPYTKRPFDIDDVRDRIPGNWAADVWKKLPIYITELFWDNLNRNGRYYAPEDRSNVKEWLLLMRRYRDELLTAGSASDMVSIFPVKSAPKKHEPEKVVIDENSDDYEVLAYEWVNPEEEITRIIEEEEKKRNDARRNKYQLDKKAEIFKDVSYSYDADSPLFVCIIVSFIVTYILYALDPMSIIVKSEYSNFPTSTLWFLAFSFIPVFLIYCIVYGPILSVFGGFRERHYFKLYQNAIHGEVFNKHNEIMKTYDGEPKTKKWYLIREYIAIGIFSVILVIIGVLLVYHGIGWLSTVL